MKKLFSSPLEYNKNDRSILRPPQERSFNWEKEKPIDYNNRIGFGISITSAVISGYFTDVSTMNTNPDLTFPYRAWVDLMGAGFSFGFMYGFSKNFKFIDEFKKIKTLIDNL